MQTGFLQGLSARGMRVDRRADVLETRAHFERKRKRRREFGDARTYTLNTEYHMIVGSSNDAHEAVRIASRQRATVGSEREPTFDAVDTRSPRLGRIETCGHDLAIGKHA